MFLIVGLVRWRGLAGRDNPHDPHALSREQLSEELLVCLTGEVVEEIDHSWSLAQDRQSSQPSQISTETIRLAGRAFVVWPNCTTGPEHSQIGYSK